MEKVIFRNNFRNLAEFRARTLNPPHWVMKTQILVKFALLKNCKLRCWAALTIITKLQIQTLKKGGLAGCDGFLRALDQTAAQPALFRCFCRQQAPRVSQEWLESPTSQTRNPPHSPADGSRRFKHAATRSAPVTRVMINERLDHLISHVIKL